MNHFIAETVDDLSAVAVSISDAFNNEKIFAFFGVMGSGKTALIKEICRYKKVEDSITSPTFSLVNEYHTKDNNIIYHFDFYRIENPEEVYDLGYEDYFFSDSVCLIEWPELIESLLPENYVKIQIEERENGIRYISCKRIIS